MDGLELSKKAKGPKSVRAKMTTNGQSFYFERVNQSAGVNKTRASSLPRRRKRGSIGSFSSETEDDHSNKMPANEEKHHLNTEINDANQFDAKIGAGEVPLEVNHAQTETGNRNQQDEPHTASGHAEQKQEAKNAEAEPETEDKNHQVEAHAENNHTEQNQEDERAEQPEDRGNEQPIDMLAIIESFIDKSIESFDQLPADRINAVQYGVGANVGDSVNSYRKHFFFMRYILIMICLKIYTKLKDGQNDNGTINLSMTGLFNNPEELIPDNRKSLVLFLNKFIDTLESFRGDEQNQFKTIWCNLLINALTKKSQEQCKDFLNAPWKSVFPLSTENSYYLTYSSFINSILYIFSSEYTQTYTLEIKQLKLLTGEFQETRKLIQDAYKLKKELNDKIHTFVTLDNEHSLFRINPHGIEGNQAPLEIHLCKGVARYLEDLDQEGRLMSDRNIDDYFEYLVGKSIHKILSIETPLDCPDQLQFFEQSNVFLYDMELLRDVSNKGRLFQHSINSYFRSNRHIAPTGNAHPLWGQELFLHYDAQTGYYVSGCSSIRDNQMHFCLQRLLQMAVEHGYQKEHNRNLGDESFLAMFLKKMINEPPVQRQGSPTVCTGTILITHPKKKSFKSLWGKYQRKVAERLVDIHPERPRSDTFSLSQSFENITRIFQDLIKTYNAWKDVIHASKKWFDSTKGLSAVRAIRVKKSIRPDLGCINRAQGGNQWNVSRDKHEYYASDDNLLRLAPAMNQKTELVKNLARSIVGFESRGLRKLPACDFYPYQSAKSTEVCKRIQNYGVVVFLGTFFKACEQHDNEQNRGPQNAR